jgi:cell division protein FtsB
MAQNWLQHTFERNGWRPQNQVVTLVILAIIITLIFGGIYLSQVANFAILNRETEDLIAERDELERKNEEIRAQIADLETIPRLLDRAQRLGFRAAVSSDIEYLVVDGYNPNRDVTNAPLIIEDEQPVAPVYDATFSGWLQQQFDVLRGQFESFGK